MAHERDSLWAYAGGELPRDDAARVAAHVALCGACAQVLDEVRAAREVMVQTPVPALPAERWKAIDAGVLEAARKELARPRWWSAWRGLWSGIPATAWVGAAAAAAIAAGVLFWPHTPMPRAPVVAEAPQVVSPPSPTPGALPSVARPLPTPGRALVASARRARVGGAPLSSRASVSDGAALSTEKQGELWLSLPDGSRAGLLGGAEMRMERASADDVSLHVEHGTLLVAAAHRAERPFRVQAGEVEIRVVGTRFLVERDDQGVSIAVDEGAVEADVGGERRRVAKGQSARFENGQATLRGVEPAQRVELARLDAAPHLRPGAPEVAAPSAALPETPPIPTSSPTPVTPTLPPTNAAPASPYPTTPAPVSPAPGPQWAPYPDSGRKLHEVPMPPISVPHP